MTVAKGHIWSDKTYRYTCGKCHGGGTLPDGAACDHCYGLDLDRLLLEFQSAVGQRYYALLKAILSLKGREIYEEAQRMTTANNGKFTPALVGYLVERFRFGQRLKPLVEWLEETHFVPSGTYELFRDNHITLKKMRAAAWDTYHAELEQAGIVPPEGF